MSLDGFRRDYLKLYAPPALTSLAAEGVIADAMIPVFPALTFPNHYSIVTGLYPEHHGIVANWMFDPEFNASFTMNNGAPSDARWWGGEPIWVTAERQGVRSASFFWVGSEAAVGGIRPSTWKRYDEQIPYFSRVDSVLEWLSLPPSRRPGMILLYFDEPDHTAHNFGPESAATRGAVLSVDSAIGRLVSGLRLRGMYDFVDVVIVSDHGMADISSERYVFLEDVTDTMMVRTLEKGPIFMGWSKTGDNAGLLAALRRLPHVQAWPRDSVPARFRYRDNRRIPAIIALAETGWMIGTGRAGRSKNLGTHGFDIADPRMHAIFIARGPAFKSGVTIPAFRNVDIYPLLAKLLGIQAAKNDGSLRVFSAALRH